jgi:hypothetical protein
MTALATATLTTPLAGDYGKARSLRCRFKRSAVLTNQSSSWLCEPIGGQVERAVIPGVGWPGLADRIDIMAATRTWLVKGWAPAGAVSEICLPGSCVDRGP